MKRDFIEPGNLSIAAANMRGRGKDPDVAEPARDPQVESLLQNRRAQLGLDAMSTKTLPQDVRPSGGRELGMSM